MNDDHAGHPHADLCHLIVVRVVHAGARLPDRELVLERLSLLYRALGEPSDTIHAIGQENPMPVDRRGCLQPIGHVDANALALHPLQDRAVHGAIVAPARGAQSRRKFVLHFFRDHVEHLHPINDLPRRTGPVGNGHGLVVAAGASGLESALFSVPLARSRRTTGSRAPRPGYVSSSTVLRVKEERTAGERRASSREHLPA